MPYYTRQGQVPHKRHTQFRRSDGDLMTEELFGREGFSGAQSLLYHLQPPTAVERVRQGANLEREFVHAGPLIHRHARTKDLLAESQSDALNGRLMLLGNKDVAFGVVSVQQGMSYYYRNAEGDELLFVHQGMGLVETQFGNLRYRPGDYLVLPVGTTYRMIPDGNEQTRLLVIESKGAITPPDRYLSKNGQFLEHSPYCERDLRLPALETHDEQGDFEVVVRANGMLTHFHYNHHPFDVVGWDGALFPYAMNIEDFEPMTGRVHLPPPVHQTFAGNGFVICSFVPRKMDYHPMAVPVPYNHSNINSDEVIYYADGNFMSRKGIEPGSVTLHPGGIPHGPQPGVTESSLGIEETKELAVMMDTFAPLGVSKEFVACEDVEYMYSWKM